ncbi:MAG: DUF421 domain-containing protein [Clostridiales bacterium]|nr:DUF421 domain-containing protein [Clostridiales bacterium]
MAVTFIRTLIIIITLMVLMRLMGKREIGEMQPYEFIITLIIADLACIPMADVSIPLTYGIVAIICVFLLHQILTILEQSGSIVRRIISGKPSVVINQNGVDVVELKRNNLGVDDLIESLRTAGYFTLDDVSYAIYETNGSLSAMPNSNKTNNANSIPLLIVAEGKIEHHNLKLIDCEKNEIIAFIKKQNSNLKKTEVLTIAGDGRVYFKEKNKKYKITSFNLKEGAWW